MKFQGECFDELNMTGGNNPLTCAYLQRVLNVGMRL